MITAIEAMMLILGGGGVGFGVGILFGYILGRLEKQ